VRSLNYKDTLTFLFDINLSVICAGKSRSALKATQKYRTNSRILLHGTKIRKKISKKIYNWIVYTQGSQSTLIAPQVELPQSCMNF